MVSVMVLYFRMPHFDVGGLVSFNCLGLVSVTRIE